MFKTTLICLLLVLNLVNASMADDLRYNVYDEPLKNCLLETDPYLRMVGNRKCDEPFGGVHQLCFINIASNSNSFSKNTGQSNWSDLRGNNNHCLCLGAWSLYVAKMNRGMISEKKSIRNNDKLKCDAIPRVALTKRYIYTWSTWNGLQVPKQIMDGVKGLYKQCVKFAKGDQKKIRALDRHYQHFMKQIPK